MAQWMYLKLSGVPLFAFNIKWNLVIIKYTSSNITDWLEVGLVAIGQLANIAIVVLLTLFAIFVSKAFDALPEIFSKFIISYGFVTVLDPYLGLVVDLAEGNWACETRSTDCAYDYTSNACTCVTGDAFKLWSRMARTEASGVTGMFYTIVVYVFCTLIAAAVVYEYILHAHMNGRMLDNVRRLHATEEDFFVPDDCEISMEQLKNILNKAQRFKGQGGVRRKVHINEFTVTDRVDKKFEEKMTHVAIFTSEVDGERTLYRHFLKQVNGSIVEIDDEIMEVFSGQMALEKLLGSIKEGKGGSVEGGQEEKAEERKEKETGGEEEKKVE